MYGLIQAFFGESSCIQHIVLDWVKSYGESKEKAFNEVIVAMYYAAGVNSFQTVNQYLYDINSITAHLMNLRVSFKVDENRLKIIGELISLILKKNGRKLYMEKSIMYRLLEILSKFVNNKWISFKSVAAVVGTIVMMYIYREITDLSGVISSTCAVTERKAKICLVIHKLKEYFAILWREVFTVMRQCPDKDVRGRCYRPIALWIDSCLDDEFFRRKFIFALYCFLNEPDETLRTISVKYYLKALIKLQGSTCNKKVFIAAISRLVKRSFDCNIEICVTALSCLTIMDRLIDNSIRKEHAALIYSLVYHQHREIASPAATFLHNRIIRKVGLDSSIDYIKQLADFHIEAGGTDLLMNGESSDDFLIDAMSNKTLKLCDWESWVTLFKETSLPEGDYSDYVDGNIYKTEILIRLLASSVRKYTTGIKPFNRIAKRNISIPISSIISHKNYATQIFITGDKYNFINVCHKYEKIDLFFYLLLSCLTYLNYSDLQMTEPITNLIKFKVNMQADNPIYLDVCIKTYTIIVLKLWKEKKLVLSMEHLSDEEENIFLSTNEEQRNLNENILQGVNTISNRLDEMLSSLLKNGGEEILKMRTEVLKFLAFTSLTDIVEGNDWAYIFNNLQCILDLEAVTVMVEHLLLTVCFMGIFWIAVYFIEDHVGHKNVEMELIFELREKCNKFYNLLKYHSRTQSIARRNNILYTIANLLDLSSFLKTNNGIKCLIYE